MSERSHPCPRTIDEPIRVLNLDAEDWLTVGGAGLVVYAFTTPLTAVIVGVLGVVALRAAKRGQPPGAMLHMLWRLGVPIPGWTMSPPPEGARYSPWP